PRAAQRPGVPRPGEPAAHLPLEGRRHQARDRDRVRLGAGVERNAHDHPRGPRPGRARWHGLPDGDGVMTRRLANALSRRLRSERGSVMIVAVMVTTLMVSMGMATAVVIDSQTEQLPHSTLVAGSMSISNRGNKALICTKLPDTATGNSCTPSSSSQVGPVQVRCTTYTSSCLNIRSPINNSVQISPYNVQ